jgi:hypothetical protein
VAKSRRAGLTERWLRRSDLDEEMWPEESFGGVSDEQFWDDIASDKPLATTARTAQDADDARPRPARRNAEGRRLPAPPAPVTPPAPPALPERAPSAQASATTQAFQITGPQPYQATGPQAVTGPQPAVGPQQVTGPQPAQPYGARPSRHAAGSQATGGYAAPQPPSAQALPPGSGRGRPGGEDPLTSDAFSLRSRGAVDGRSYQAARRPQDLSHDQYEAAMGQDTQAFGITDAPPSSGPYPGDSSPGGQYPSGQYPSGQYPGGSSQRGSYASGSYPSGTGSYPAASGSYPAHGTGAYPAGQPSGRPQEAAPGSHRAGGRHRDEDRGSRSLPASGAYPPAAHGGDVYRGSPYPYSQPASATPLTTQTPPSGYGTSDYDYALGDYPNPAADQYQQRDNGRPANGRDRDRDRDGQGRYPAQYDSRGSGRR